MFKIDDLVVYSVHGICRVTDICEKTVLGDTKQYYILQPLEDNHNLTISAPVDNKKATIQSIVGKEDAKEIIDSFKDSGVEWYDKPNKRLNSYTSMIKSGDRNEIAKVVNTLMRRKIEVEKEDKKLNQQDLKLLKNIQTTFFKELSLALDTSVEKINRHILKLIKSAA